MRRKRAICKTWILKVMGALVAVSITSTLVYAISVPNKFVDGTIASATQVNANFKYVADKIFNPSFGTVVSMTNILPITGGCGKANTAVIKTTLPDANSTYLVTYHLRVSLRHKAGTAPPSAWIQGMMFDKEKNSTIQDSEVLVSSTSVSDEAIQATGTMSFYITTSKSNYQIEMIACRSGNGTWIASNVLSNSGGRTKIVYQRVK